MPIKLAPPMYEWLLTLHVLAAFALAGGLAAFWTLTVATRSGWSESIAAIARPFAAMTAAGTLLTLVFGIWLAIYLDEYQPWDGWILASIALWVVGTGAGRQTGEEMTRSARGGPEAAAHRRRGVVFHVVASLSVLAILALMIFKPGA
jgi:uncharacterized membrane protein